MQETISLPRDMAVRKALASCSIVPKIERIALSEALGRVSAEDVLSTDCVPPSMASRFDGIAIDYDRVFASSSSTGEGVLELLPRDIVSASTGCVLPKGFDTVICKERVTLLDGGAVRTETPINKGQNTIPKGMLQQEGDVLVRKGEVISPLCLAKLANSDYEYVAVNSKPRVSILCCGSNLVPLGMPLDEGFVRESNSHLIGGKVMQWGGTIARTSIVSCREELLSLLKESLDSSDFVIVNAGSSKGEADYTLSVLEEVGQVLNHMVGSAPGRHVSYSLVSGKIVVGLSGLLQSAEHTIDWYVKPVVDVFLGKKTIRHTVRGILDTEVRTDKSIPFTIRALARYCEDTGEIRVFPLSSPNDILQRANNECNCFLTVSQNDKLISQGSEVEIELREGSDLF